MVKDELKNQIYNEYSMFEIIQKSIQEKECRIIEMVYMYIISKLEDKGFKEIKYYMYNDKKIVKVFEENGTIQLEADNGEIISFFMLSTKQKVILSYMI